MIGLAYIFCLTIDGFDEITSGPASSTKDYVPIIYGKIDEINIVEKNELCIFTTHSSVTSAALTMYYIFLYNQSAVAFAEFDKAQQAYRDKKIEEKPTLMKIKYGLDNTEIIVANRLAGNYNEQLLPFLISLYMYATYASVRGAVHFGWAWLFFRCYYGQAYRRGVMLFLSTLPAYCCIWGMICGTLYEVTR
eukprot:scaffold13204_cov66-Cyclotella_meneghiniana.AAC.2